MLPGIDYVIDVPTRTALKAAEERFRVLDGGLSLVQQNQSLTVSVTVEGGAFSIFIQAATPPDQVPGTSAFWIWTGAVPNRFSVWMEGTGGHKWFEVGRAK